MGVMFSWYFMEKALMIAWPNIQYGDWEMKGGLSHDPIPPQGVFSLIISLFEDFDQII